MSSSTKNDSDAKKFLFDTNNFGENKVPERERPAYSENQLTLAREQSYAEGKSAGLAEADKSLQDRMFQCLLRIEVEAQKLIADEERRETEKMLSATKLALRVTQKLLPQFAQKFALPEIERTILDAIDARRDEARIAITVPTAHLEALKKRIDALALEKGYAGKVILISDDGMALTDCRVEWADGGAERLYEKLFAQVEHEFGRAVAGMVSTLNDEKKDA